MTDPFLLEAQREVDAMLPGTPSIAPAPSVGPDAVHREEMLRYAEFNAEKQQFVLRDGTVITSQEFGDNPRISALRAFSASKI